MAALGKGKKNLTANVDSRVRAYVMLRGAAGEYSASKMAGLIVRWWLAQGAPPVIEGEPGAAKLPWEPNVKWETLLEAETIPAKAALPRDHAASIRRY